MAIGERPFAACLTVADFLASPLAQIVFLLALTAALVAVGVYVISKVRAGLRREEPDASAWLTEFRDLHAEGQLSDREFDTIKAMLAKQLRSEINDTDAPS